MRILITDTETASLDGGVCEVAITQINSDLEVLWQVDSLTDPECDVISPGAGAKHGLRIEQLRDKPTLGQFMEMNNYPFDHDNLMVIGHNISFDIRMMQKYFVKPFRKLDTLTLARLLFPTLDNHQLSTLVYAFDLETGTAHRAPGDVLACLSFMREVKRQMGLDLWQQYALTVKPLSPDDLMPFGKHKGMKIRHVPRSWMCWALANINDMDEQLRKVFQQLV